MSFKMKLVSGPTPSLTAIVSFAMPVLCHRTRDRVYDDAGHLIHAAERNDATTSDVVDYDVTRT